jgi:protoporphyrinogen oxidase
MSANVILGGGFTGLFSALLLVEKYKQKNVVIIESSNQIGGAYNSCFLEKNRYFDFGPHLVYESENDEINQLIISLMNDDQWLFLEKNEKDIPGLYYNGALQEHSHYIDIRTLDNTLYHECIADLFINLDHKSNEKSKDHSAEEYFINKFGKIITNTAIKKIIKKLWGKDLNSIDWFVAKLVSMDRVVAFSEETMLDLMKAEKIRERIAYPNQYTFPSEKRSSKQRALYPKEFGFFRIIDALKKRLEEQGVKIYMSTSIESLNVIDNKIKSISFLKNNTTEIDSIDDIRHIHSTIDLVHITKYLNIKYEKPKLDEHRKVAYVFLSLKSRPEMGKLYYFYVFDEKFKTFRVTSYANYCNDAAKNGEYPVCV